MTDFKPMLSGKAPADLTKLRYPLLASPKLDGIRCIIRRGGAVSRNLKPIPNERVREYLSTLPPGIDGELMVQGGFNACQSFFMSKQPKEWTDDWFLFAFDWHGKQDFAFEDRLRALTTWSEEYGHNNLHVVEHKLITNADDLAAFEAECLADGFEGVMVRDPRGPYKFGRSTTREGYLLKIKQFVDEEATIVGVEELMRNENELEQDELGHAKRSAAKAGLVPAGCMGMLRCRTEDGAEFGIGSGFTQWHRNTFWSRREELVGKLVTFKHQPDPGGRQPGQAPRFPVFKGLRHENDLS